MSGDPHLISQHLRGGGRWISEIEARLFQRESFRIARAMQKNSGLYKQTNKQKAGKNSVFYLKISF